MAILQWGAPPITWMWTLWGRSSAWTVSVLRLPLQVIGIALTSRSTTEISPPPLQTTYVVREAAVNSPSSRSPVPAVSAPSARAPFGSFSAAGGGAVGVGVQDGLGDVLAVAP